MKHYLEIMDGIIIAIHSCFNPPKDVETLTDEAFTELMDVYNNKPEDTLDTVYRLSAETRQWGPFVRTKEENIKWYTDRVVVGDMSLEEVPEEYRNAVESVLPINYEQKVVNSIMEEVSDYAY